jgi:hypothetical protein
LRILAAALLSSWAVAHGATITIEALPGERYVWTPEVSSSGDAFAPMVVGVDDATLMSAGWWQTVDDPGQYITRLWRDTDSAPDTWSLGELVYDSRNPVYFTLFGAGEQLVFELINLKPDRELRGALLFATPLPAAGWLFGSGVLALLGWSRKRGRSSSG